MSIKISISKIYPEFIPDYPSIVDFVDNSTFEKSAHIFIQEFIRNIFHTNHIGSMNRIELLEIISINYYNTYYTATCWFDSLYDTPEAGVFLNNISRDHHKMYYGDHHKMYYGEYQQKCFYVSQTLPS